MQADATWIAYIEKKLASQDSNRQKIIDEVAALIASARPGSDWARLAQQKETDNNWADVFAAVEKLTAKAHHQKAKKFEPSTERPAVDKQVVVEETPKPVLEIKQVPVHLVEKDAPAASALKAPAATVKSSGLLPSLLAFLIDWLHFETWRLQQVIDWMVEFWKARLKDAKERGLIPVDNEAVDAALTAAALPVLALWQIEQAQPIFEAVHEPILRTAVGATFVVSADAAVKADETWIAFFDEQFRGNGVRRERYVKQVAALIAHARPGSDWALTAAAKRNVASWSEVFIEVERIKGVASGQKKSVPVNHPPVRQDLPDLHQPFDPAAPDGHILPFSPAFRPYIRLSEAHDDAVVQLAAIRRERTLRRNETASKDMGFKETGIGERLAQQPSFDEKLRLVLMAVDFEDIFVLAMPDGYAGSGETFIAQLIESGITDRPVYMAADGEGVGLKKAILGAAGVTFGETVADGVNITKAVVLVEQGQFDAGHSRLFKDLMDRSSTVIDHAAYPANEIRVAVELHYMDYADYLSGHHEDTWEFVIDLGGEILLVSNDGRTVRLVKKDDPQEAAQLAYLK
jgi:hypothetical protein